MSPQLIQEAGNSFKASPQLAERKGGTEGGRCVAASAGSLPEPKSSLRATAGVCGHSPRGTKVKGEEHSSAAP